MILNKKGIIFSNKNLTISLDNYNNSADYCFMSHAHSDHLFNTSKKIICSDETKDFAGLRRKKISDYVNKDFSVNDTHIRMVDSGHVLGSKSLIIDDGKKTVYTGDFCTRDRSFLKGFRPVKCDNLIIETTFCSPKYVFPDYKSVINEFKDFSEDCLSKGKNLLLLGYSLGKAQHICKITETFNHPVYVHSAVKKMNNIYRNHGIELAERKIIDEMNEGQNIVVSPKAALRNKIIKKFRKDKNTVTVAFSGWAVNNGYTFSVGADKSFVLSDHCDFSELLRTIKECSPSKVYAHHGCSDEFIHLLRAEGFDSNRI